jgi:hypothetical protein
MSLQLEQVLSQVRQLSPHDQRQLVAQLVGEGAQANEINEAQGDLTEAELEYVNGVLVVKSQQPGTLDLDLVEFIKEQREERDRQVGGW